MFAIYGKFARAGRLVLAWFFVLVAFGSLATARTGPTENETAEIRLDASLRATLALDEQLAAGTVSESDAANALSQLGIEFPAAQARSTLQNYLFQLRHAVDVDLDIIVNHHGAVGERTLAVARIARATPHPSFLPILRSVALSSDEPESLRVWAVKAVSSIPHDNTVPELAGYLDDPVLRHSAKEQLQKLTNYAPTAGDPPSTWRTAYENWWKAHSADFKFDRNAAIREY